MQIFCVFWNVRCDGGQDGKQGFVAAAGFQGGNCRVARMPEDSKHYMVRRDVVPACPDSLAAALFEDLNKIVGKAQFHDAKMAIFRKLLLYLYVYNHWKIYG